MDILWIGIAFLLGFAVKQVGLPPLVGYLAAGFGLHAFGFGADETLQDFADLGVTLLLFTIGLKLRVGSLMRPEIWGVAALHMAVTIAVLGAMVLALSVAGVSLFAGLDLRLSLIVALALSFSSTVFAVKVLEEKGEMASLYGRIAIGILIMQDLAAVVFLAISAGKMPSPWALLLLGLIPMRVVLAKIMDRAGHGELLVLLGLAMALGGAELFELVGMKGDLGALFIGVLVASHPKATEIAKSLLSLKDVFLVGFFLTIGMSGAPSFEILGIAVLLASVVPLKMALFFWLLTRFRIRARTAFLSALSLANYSEFGLIVASVSVANGWLSADWLVIIAVAVAMLFVAASPLNSGAHALYRRYRDRLKPFEGPTRIPEEQPIDVGDVSAVVFGMGRTGTGTYDAMRGFVGDDLVGIDFDENVVARHLSEGRNVIRGSATDPDFWSRIDTAEHRVEYVLLAMSSHAENLFAAKQINEIGYKGHIAATARYEDEVAELRAAGVDAVFDLYQEAGVGFVDLACATWGVQPAASR